MSFDAILIPGGGIREHGRLPPWSEARLDRAIGRYAGEYVILLSAGTVHKPPVLDDHDRPIFESVAAGRYLAARGIPPDRIRPETCSYDTIGNAYFSRVIHVDPRGFHRLLVITSAFHLPRTEAIFRWVYGLSPSRAVLDFEAVPDVGIESLAVAARLERESKSLQQLRTLIPRLTTLHAFHQWLFTEHEAYTLNRPESTVGAAIETY